MIDTYNVEAVRKLSSDPLAQVYNALRPDDYAGALTHTDIKDGISTALQDQPFNYSHMDTCYKNQIENIHAYNTLAFALQNNITQSTPELGISPSRLCAMTEICVNYTNYSLIDYVAIISHLKEMNETEFKRMVYLQFYTFYMKKQTNPFESAEDMFNTIVNNRATEFTIIALKDDLYAFKSYTPKRSFLGEAHYKLIANSRSGNENAKAWNLASNDKWVKEYEIQIYACSKRDRPYEIRSSNIGKHNEFVGHYWSQFDMHDQFNDFVKKEDAFFEGIFETNPFFICVEDKVKKAKKVDLQLVG